MRFSIVIIARNEEANIAKLAESAKDYLTAGGRIFLLDTGSTDNTATVAANLGFDVTVSKTNFQRRFENKDLMRWMKKFNIKKRPVQVPVDYFCFDDARNAAAELSDVDMIFFMDGCDYFINFDYESINNDIADGYENFMVVQSYGGSEGRINRFYSRRKGKWMGHVHEFIEGTKEMKSKNLPREVMCICHQVVEKDRTAKYMAGLIETHMENPIARWHYYLGRELHFNGFYVDAKNLMQRCYNDNFWQEERAAAMCWCAKISKAQGFKPEQVQEYFQKAYDVGSTLREPYFEVCQWHMEKQNWSKLLECATKAIELVTTTPVVFFEEARFHDVSNLYTYMYIGQWWAGSKDESVKYWRKYLKSRNMKPEDHPHWSFFSEYRSLPDIKYTIQEMSISGETFQRLISDDAIIKEADRVFDELIGKVIKKYVNVDGSSNIIISPTRSQCAIEVARLSESMTSYIFEPDTIKFQRLNCDLLLSSTQNVKVYNARLSEVSDFSKDEIGITEIDFKKVSSIWIGSDWLHYISLLSKIIQRDSPFICLMGSSVDYNPDRYKKIAFKNLVCYQPSLEQSSGDDI